MYSIAYLAMVASFIFSVLTVCFTASQLFTNQKDIRVTHCLELVNIAVISLVTLSCLFLIYAFVACDFSLRYVYSYSSTTLPLFYRVTAFWAGQSGSMLFWAWTVIVSGTIFMALDSYKKMTNETKQWYWCCYFSIIAFFLFLLITWCNPFETLSTPYQEGQGLNPLLQNPGMIFHPPLLFLGYGGFVIPGCLALAQSFSQTQQLASTSFFEQHWKIIGRPFALVGWAMLTAGIILGAWWAYMELGWGGYWAWDPVENASLIPWLVASAYLHTSAAESKQTNLGSVNVFLVCLTTISAFFATYLVRSGIIDSLHAFGQGGLGIPYLIFIAVFFGITLCACFSLPKVTDNIWKLREILMCTVAVILLVISVDILIGTLWPVIINGVLMIADQLPLFIQQKLPAKPMGLSADFYNHTCLPLFTLICAILAICPQLKRQSNKTHNIAITGAILLGVAVIAVFLTFMGIKEPLSVIATSVSIAAIAGIVMFFIAFPQQLSNNRAILAHGTHIGLLLIAIGIAFSGPYQIKRSFSLSKGQTATFDDYSFTLLQFYEGDSAPSPDQKANYIFLEIELLVKKDGKELGVVNPQIRHYAGYENMRAHEVGTIFSLGNEVKATFEGYDLSNMKAEFSIHINPLINWLWIGGTIMSLFPLLCLFKRKKTLIGSSPEPAELG